MYMCVYVCVCMCVCVCERESERERYIFQTFLPSQRIRLGSKLTISGHGDSIPHTKSYLHGLWSLAMNIAHAHVQVC